jgi:hypothetical protein
MTPEASGWAPLTRAWAGGDPTRALSLPLFDWLVPLALIYLRSYCRVLIALPQSSLVLPLPYPLLPVFHLCHFFSPKI